MDSCLTISNYNPKDGFDSFGLCSTGAWEIPPPWISYEIVFLVGAENESFHCCDLVPTPSCKNECFRLVSSMSRQSSVGRVATEPQKAVFLTIQFAMSSYFLPTVQIRYSAFIPSLLLIFTDDWKPLHSIWTWIQLTETQQLFIHCIDD